VHSLQALVGSASLKPPPSTLAGGTGPGKVVVVGDSTAAGLGNRALPHATAQDKACGRSADTYARALAAVNRGQVTNLACSGATIAAGLLGSQRVGDISIPPQLDDPAVAQATTVIISIGANDVGWSTVLQVCAVSPSCLDNAVLAYLQQRLAGFSTDYLELLTALQSLSNHPRVLINLYYDPFSGDVSCLRSAGMTDAKLAAVNSALAALNKILSSGTKAASFTSAQPDFTGHGVCSEQPWVQGLHDHAPFHPTASGEWAIALTDERALNAASVTPPEAGQ
jgi:lysophospholipase L1-like esterase